MKVLWQDGATATSNVCWILNESKLTKQKFMPCPTKTRGMWSLVLVVRLQTFHIAVGVVEYRPTLNLCVHLNWWCLQPRLSYSTLWWEWVCLSTLITARHSHINPRPLGMFRLPRWHGLWKVLKRDITGSCVIWRHVLRPKFRRCKQTWKMIFWGWPLTCDHDVTFRRSRSE